MDPSGVNIATIDREAVCLVSRIDSQEYLSNFKLKQTNYPNCTQKNVFRFSIQLFLGKWNRCRWNPVSGVPKILTSFDTQKIAVFDIEKQAELNVRCLDRGNHRIQ